MWICGGKGEFLKHKMNDLDSRTTPFEEGGNNRNLSRSNTKTFHRLSMVIQIIKGSTILVLNQRTTTCLPFEYIYSQLKNNNSENKMNPTLNTQDASMGWSLFG